MSHSTLNPQYFSHPLDLEILRRHTQWLETIAATEPIASLMKKDDRRIHSEKPVYNLETAKQIVAETFISGHHVTSIQCCLINLQRLIVYNVPNLRIVDTSTFPIIPRGISRPVFMLWPKEQRISSKRIALQGRWQAR